MKYFKVELIPSLIAGIVLGAILMIGPGCIGLAASPYLAIGLFCIGDFAHRMTSALLHALSADVFDPDFRTIGTKEQNSLGYSTSSVRTTLQRGRERSLNFRF
jgi:hypothetical protein